VSEEHDTFANRVAYLDAVAATEPAERPNLAAVRLPAEFWGARPFLKHVQAAAWAKRAHPDAVLGALLTRTAASIPPSIKFNSSTDGGEPDGSTNLYACLLAPSGIGKSRAGAAAESLTAIAGLTPYPTYTLGSGEGLIEAYLGLVDQAVYDPITMQLKTDRRGNEIMEKKKVQVRDKAFFWVDEGATLNTLLTRIGATLGPTLRSAWTGGELGQANASADTTRRLGAGRYSLGLLVGYQPGTAAQLLGDAGTGMPQRFLWFGAQDKQMPTEPMPWPGRLQLPEFKPGAVDFDRAIKAELIEYDVAKHHGTVVVDELDSHEPLMRCKVATLLCLIDGRRLVGDEDWQLAKTIVGTSVQIRGALVDALEVERERERQERAWERGLEDVARRSARSDVQRVAERIQHKAASDGWFHFGRWKKDQGRDKKWCTDGLAYAEARGWVVRKGAAVEPVRDSASQGGQGGQGGRGDDAAQ
jgi:hypothetical protein